MVRDTGALGWGGCICDMGNGAWDMEGLMTGTRILGWDRVGMAQGKENKMCTTNLASERLIFLLNFRFPFPKFLALSFLHEA